MSSEWQSATMSDVVTHYRGGEAFGKLEYASSGIPVIAKGDVKQYGSVSGSFSRFITEERWQEKGYKKTAKGDFVLTTRDLTQAANFLGLLAPVPEPYDFLVNQGANIVKFDHSFDPVYLVYWSHSSQYREHIKNSAVCSTQIHLRKEDFLFGLYEGIPKIARWNYGFSPPDKITIFKEEIERYSKSEEDIKMLLSVKSVVKYIHVSIV